MRVRLQAQHFEQAGDVQPKSPLCTSHFLQNIQKIITSLSNLEKGQMQSAADLLRCLLERLGECECVKRATEGTRQALFSPFQFTLEVGTQSSLWNNNELISHLYHPNQGMTLIYTALRICKAFGRHRSTIHRLHVEVTLICLAADALPFFSSPVSTDRRALHGRRPFDARTPRAPQPQLDHLPHARRVHGANGPFGRYLAFRPALRPPRAQHDESQ